jgi:Zn-dependent protease
MQRRREHAGVPAVFFTRGPPLFGPIDWQRAVYTIIILLIAIDIHELAHAIVADRLGDPTPRRMGEMSLNPFVHMDQFGIILLFILSISGWGFTYGRTHVTPTNLKFGTQRGNAIVAIAGPLSNLALAALLVIVLALSARGYFTLSYNQRYFLSLAIGLNVLLFLINLLPIPPLDGFTILGGFLSARQMYSLAPLQQWGPLVILLLFITNPSTHILDNIILQPTYQIITFLCSATGCYSA